MRAATLVPVALLGAGVALVAGAVASGDATVSLVVVFPVVTGRSPEFLVGVVALVLGAASAFLVGATPSPPGETDPGSDPAGPSAAGESCGILLIGPVPIVFGSFRPLGRRVYWVLALVGAAGVGAALLFVLWASR
jgi:uncharacterized membrane protein